MNRYLVAVMLSCCALLLAGAAPLRDFPPNTAFYVCVQEPGAETRIAVSGPQARKLNRHLDDWTQGQVKNAIRGVIAQRGGNLAEPLEVRFEPEQSMSRRRKEPGSWGDDKSGKCYDCRCAEAMFDAQKQFKGCSVAACNGCMVCHEVSC
jgi:hypothetical protein